MANNYSVAKFIEALDRDELDLIVLEGMVKKDEGLTGNLLFAIDGGCERWITAPSDLVSGIEYLSTNNCKDHTHPRVRLHLKLPAIESVATRFFAEFVKRSAIISGLRSHDGPIIKPRIGPCQKQPDGTFGRTVDRPDGSTVVTPCMPPRAPVPTKELLVSIKQYWQTADDVQIMGIKFTPNGSFLIHIFDAAGKFLESSSGTADTSGRFNEVARVDFAFPIDLDHPLRIYAYDLTNHGYGMALIDPTI
jgi:hypothetical protein